MADPDRSHLKIGHAFLDVQRAIFAPTTRVETVANGSHINDKA